MVITASVALPASPPNNPQAGVVVRSNQVESVTPSASTSYSRSTPQPPCQRPRPPESGHTP